MKIKICDDIINNKSYENNIVLKNNKKLSDITNNINKYITTYNINIKDYSIFLNDNLITKENYSNIDINNDSNLIFFIKPGNGETQAIAGAGLIIIGAITNQPGIAMMGVSLLLGGISLMLMPDTPENTVGNKNYGFGGIQTEYSLGSTYPLVYGRSIVGGKVLSQRIYSNENDDQVLDTLLVVSYGEIRGIRKQDNTGICTDTTDAPWIKIDNNFISNYEGYEWDYRLGTNDQQTIPLFNDQSTIYSDNQELNDQFYTISDAGGGEDFDSVEFNFSFPNGLYNVDSYGYVTSAMFSLYIEYSKAGENDWNQVSFIYSEKKTGQFYRTYRIELPERASYDFRIKVISLTTAVFNSFDENTFLGKVIKTAEPPIHENKINLQSYNRIIKDDYSYPGFALVAVRAIATSQLDNSTPNYNIKLDGKLVDYYDGGWQGETWDSNGNDEGNISRNPSWVLYDLIYNDFYGLGNIYREDLNHLDKWIELADYSNELIDDGQGGTERRFSLDYIVDNIVNSDSLIKELLQSYHCYPVTPGTSFYPQLDKSRPPTNFFGMGDVLTDDNGNTRLVESWFSSQDKANVINLQYYDIENDLNPDIVQYPTDDVLIGTFKIIRKQDTTVRSITRRSEAIRFAKWLYKLSVLRNRSITFPTFSTASNNQPGDVIGFSHDIPQFGYSGKIFRQRTTSEIELDNNWDNVDTGLHSYKLLVKDIDDDTQETLDVNNITRDNNRIIATTSTSFSFTPDRGDSYCLIEDSTSPSLYVITTINRDMNLNVNITAVNYDEDLYDDNIDTFDNSTLSNIPNPNAAPSNPQNLTLTQLLNKPGFYIYCIVPTDEIQYDHSRMFISTDGINYDEFYRGRRIDNVIYSSVITGGRYYIKVTTYNKNGRPCETSLISSIDITGVITPPNVRGLEIFNQGNNNVFIGQDCKFQWKLATNFQSLGISSLGEEIGGLGQYQTQYLKDNLVEIWVNNNQVRQEYVTDNWYIYSWEKNLEDNDGIPQRSFTIKVKYRDNYNNLSSDYATLSVSNTAPNMSAITPVIVNKAVGIKATWSRPSDKDLSYYIVYMDTFSPPTTQVATLAYGTESFEINGLTSGNTYYIQIEPCDVFGSGIKSQISSGSPTFILLEDVSSELTSRLILTDSLDSINLTELLDYDLTTGVNSYTSGDWIEYEFPQGQTINGVWFVASASCNCYIAYKELEDSSWSYLKAEADHTLDSELRLIKASNESDAQTNYWTANAGSGNKNIAFFPNGLQAKYLRLYVLSSITLAELHFQDQVAAELITAAQIQALAAQIDELYSSDFGTSTGTYWDLRTDGNLIMGGSSSPKFSYNGTTQELIIRGSTIILDTTNALIIEAGGNVLFNNGSDLVLSGDNVNPAKIFFNGSIYQTSFYTYESGSTLYLRPSDTGVTLKIGVGNSGEQFSNIEMHGIDGMKVFTTLTDYWDLSDSALVHSDTPDLGSLTLHFNETFTTSIYRDNEYALSCLPGKTNAFDGDALSLISNMEFENDGRTKGVRKYKPSTVPKEIQGPTMNWGYDKNTKESKYKDIITINTDMRIAMLEQAIRQLNNKLENISKDK